MIKVVRQLSPETTGTQDFTSAGLGTVKGVLAISNYATGNNGGSSFDHNVMSIGMTDLTTQSVFAVRDEDNVANANCLTAYNTTALVTLPATSTTGIELVGSYLGLVSDGVQLDWTNTTRQSLATLIMIGGDSVTVKSGSISLPDDTLTHEETTGFQPDLILFSYDGKPHNEGAHTVADDILISFGAATNTGTQRCTMFYSDHAAASSAVNTMVRDDCIGGRVNATSNPSTIQLVDIGSTSFTIRMSGSETGDALNYTALKLTGWDIWLGTIISPTGTGESEVTSPGFQPDFCMEVVSAASGINVINIDTGGEGFGIGVSDGTTQVANTIISQDNVPTMNTRCYSTDEEFLIIDSPSTDLRATFTEFTANGWSRNFTVVDVSSLSRFFWGIGLKVAEDVDEPNIISGSRLKKAHEYFRNVQLFLPTRELVGRKLFNMCGRGDYFDINGPLWAPGILGASLSYDGSGYCSLDGSVLPSYPYTILVWFKTSNTTASNRTIFALGNSGSPSHETGLRLNSSHQLQGFVQAGSSENTATFSEVANTNSWRVGAIRVYSASLMDVLLDGELGSTGSTSAGAFPTLNLTTIGATRNTTVSENFIGNIGQVIVYSRILSQTDIQKIILKPLEPFRRNSKPYRFFIDEAIPEIFYPYRPVRQIISSRRKIITGHIHTRTCNAWFPLNEYGAGRVNNLIGHSSASIGGATWAKSDFGGCLNFDGEVNGPRVNWRNSRLSFRHNEPITIMAWCKLPDFEDTRRRIIVAKDGDGFNQYNYYFAASSNDPNQLEFHYRSDGQSHHFNMFDNMLGENTWFHATFTYVFGLPNSALFYVNGEPQAGSWTFGDGIAPPFYQDNHTIFGNQGDLRIGYLGTESHRYLGQLMDIRIFRQYVDSTFIKSIINFPFISLQKQDRLYRFPMIQATIPAMMGSYRRRRNILK